MSRGPGSVNHEGKLAETRSAGAGSQCNTMEREHEGLRECCEPQHPAVLIILLCLRWEAPRPQMAGNSSAPSLLPSLPLPPAEPSGLQSLWGGWGPGEGCAYVPSQGWRHGAWPSPRVRGARGKGKAMLPGYGRSRSARHLLSLWGAGGKGQSQLSPTCASVLQQVAWHKGPRAAHSSR